MASRKLFANVVFVGTAVVGAVLAQPARLVSSAQRLTFPVSLEGKRVPNWSGNAFVVADGLAAEPGSFLAWDRSGALVFSAAFSIPGAAHTYVDGYTRGTDGTLALCGQSYAGDGRGAPFIAWISADGNSQHVIRTEPYTPYLIAMAADGTLWTVGRELNANRSERSGVNLSAGVLRHFDRSGKLLGDFLPRSSFTTSVELLVTSGYMAASADRVGWFHHDNNANGAYTEVEPDGTIANYPIPQLANRKGALQFDGFALTDSGNVFVSMREGGANSGPSVFSLNRSTMQWSQVTLSPAVSGNYFGLRGANGSELVVSQAGDRPSQVRFYAPGQ
jgi:hypothetical protein